MPRSNKLRALKVGIWVGVVVDSSSIRNEGVRNPAQPLGPSSHSLSLSLSLLLARLLAISFEGKYP